jgi:hypothetical protein
VAWPVTRFLIESVLDNPAYILGLRLSQFVSAVLFRCGLLAWWWISRQPLGRYADRAELVEGEPLSPPMGALVVRPSKRFTASSGR